MVVVNAANEPKIKAYLKHLQNESTVIDGAHPECQLSKNVHVRDMRDTRTGDDCRVDIALQGPKSIELLLPLVGDSREALEKLQTFCFIEEQIDGIDCIISRTGYTGAKISFELFVHPDNAAVLWQKLLDSGENLGILPCGLGARDSLRIEAGLPLYGHELAGDFDISPFEAGYGWAVKLEKEFFIGKEAATEQAENFDMQVARIELSGQKGVRPVRQNDCIVVDNKCIGWILSSAKAKDTQIGLAYMKKDVVVEGNKLTVHYMPRKAGENERIELGEDVQGDIEGKILKRFAKF
jgi:glycine hydroxymethyltransferase